MNRYPLLLLLLPGTMPLPWNMELLFALEYAGQKFNRIQVILPACIK